MRLGANVTRSALGVFHLRRSKDNQVFDTPPPLYTCVPMRLTHSPPLLMSTCCRREIHLTLLKQLVQRPSGPKAEIQL